MTTGEIVERTRKYVLEEFLEDEVTEQHFHTLRAIADYVCARRAAEAAS
jgi:hypothetical protein